MAAKGEVRYLAEAELEGWDALVESSRQGAVFCHSWWLRAATGSARVLGYFEGGKLRAGLPLFFKKTFAMTVATMPKLTQTLGPVLDPGLGEGAQGLSRETEVLKALAAGVADLKNVTLCFHPSLGNWLPFHWRGFRQTSRVTYALDGLADEEALWAGLKDNIRSDIKKARKAGVEVGCESPEEAYQTFEKTFARQSLSISYSLPYFRGLYEAAKQRGRGECFLARGADGQIHAAAFLAWDRKRAYYLAGGGNPQLRKSGATSLLIWHLIRFADGKSECFDFEGSMIEPVENFFRAFGGRQTGYHVVYRRPAWAELALRLRRGGR